MAKLDTSLTGKLPCVVCGYELQGLSIRSVCPECGTAVRATILYRVDPKAEEFKPIQRPRLTAIGLVIWSLGALVAVMACWLPRLGETWAVVTRALNTPEFSLAGPVSVIAAAVSGVSLLLVVRPTRDTPVWKSLLLFGAVLLYVPIVWSLWATDRLDRAQPLVYFSDSIAVERIALRLVQGVSIAASLLCVRPIARDLVKRSLVMRTGRVDRQTLMAMTAVVMLGAVGDGLRLWAAVGAGPGELWFPAAIGTLVIAFASTIFTLGLVSALVDSYRIHKAILIPSPSLRQLIGEHG